MAAAQDGSTVGTAVHDVLGTAAAEGQQIIGAIRASETKAKAINVGALQPGAIKLGAIRGGGGPR